MNEYSCKSEADTGQVCKVNLKIEPNVVLVWYNVVFLKLW
jgi:hypothetical protein